MEDFKQDPNTSFSSKDDDSNIKASSNQNKQALTNNIQNQNEGDAFASDSEDQSQFIQKIFAKIDSIQTTIRQCINTNSIDNLSKADSSLLSLKKFVEEGNESIYDDLNNSIFELSADNDTLKSKLNASNKKCESLTKEVEKLKKSKSDIDIEDEISELQLDKVNLQLEIDNLRTENEDLKQKMQSFHSAEIQNEVLVEWREKYFQMANEKSSLSKEIESIKDDNKKLKDEHQEMAQKMASVNEIIEKLNLQTTESENLRKKVEELNQQIKQSKEKEYLRQLEQTKQTISKIQTENSSLKSKNDEFQSKLIELNDLKKLNEQLMIENSQIGRFKLQVLEMEKLLANHEATILENVEVKTENQNLKKKSFAFQQKLKESLEQSEMLIKTLTDYRTKIVKITELENENLELTETIEKLKDELSQKDQLFESLQGKIEEKLTNLVRENQELKLALREQVEIHDEQSKQQELNQKKIQILTEMNSESLGKTLIEKDAEIETLKKDNQTLETISRVSAEQIFQFQKIIDTIKSQVSLLSQENTNIKNDCMNMKDELQSKEEEIKELKSKISMLESINDDQFSDDEEVENLKKEKEELLSKVNLVELANVISLKSRIKNLTDQLEESRFQNRLLHKQIENKSSEKSSITNNNNKSEVADNDNSSPADDEIEVETDEDFVDVDVSPPVFVVEKKGLDDIRSEFVRYLDEVDQIDDVIKVIKSEDDRRIRDIFNEIRKPDKKEIRYLQNELNSVVQKNKEILEEVEQLRIKNAEQSKKLEVMSHDSEMYQKHFDDLAHLLKK